MITMLPEDKMLIEARNDSLQLEQLAVNDLEKNIDGYIEPNWRTRRMIGAYKNYVTSGGLTNDAEYRNMREAFTETSGKSNRVFSNVLASHIRKRKLDLTQSMFKGYVANTKSRDESSGPIVNGEDGEFESNDVWARAIHGASRHLELHGWWKCKFRAPDTLVTRMREKILVKMTRLQGEKIVAALSGDPGAPLQIKLNSNHAATFVEFYQLAADPFLVSIVQDYMGVPPIFNTPVSFFNSIAEAKNERALSATAQLYHHDMHRLGFVKVFIYLTDVSIQSGPHTLVQGTHRKRPKQLWDDGRHTDEEIAEAGLSDQEVKITGPAGTVFLVDTSCLHKGAHPETEPRLMAQVQYTNSLFGKPIASSDHKIELISKSSESKEVAATAALARKYAAKAGVRFMQNYI